jgi:glutamate-5-semialdehyde dehydrogenase
MTIEPLLQAGDLVAIGRYRTRVTAEFASSLMDGDQVLALSGSGELRRLPKHVVELVEGSVGRAMSGFEQLSAVSDQAICQFFELASIALLDDEVFAHVQSANISDVESARVRGRSTTRLALTDSMRHDMVSALMMWRDAPMSRNTVVSRIQHIGWTVEELSASLGVIGFVFEGRPNVFADATGVLKGGNAVVFRIGSDALGTAHAMMNHVIHPSLRASGLPDDAVVLLDSPEHAAGWALFSDSRLSLAVARGSGDAVAELGSIAQQSGIPVSLHGTGGAWMIVGESADDERLRKVIQNSVDRKVCNTLNVICVQASFAEIQMPIVMNGLESAAQARGVRPRIHAVNGAERFLPPASTIQVRRAEGIQNEFHITTSNEASLGTEFEWEENPECAIVLVDSVAHAVKLFNEYSPQFIVSIVSQDAVERELVWSSVNAPFVGDGFTRWVDGQFSLLRPELGLSNWEFGRLFGRSGILSGDSAFSVRLRVQQSDPELHR